MADAYVQHMKGQILDGVTLSVPAHGKRASSHVKGRDLPVNKKQKTKTSTSGRSNKPKETDTRDRPTVTSLEKSKVPKIMGDITFPAPKTVIPKIAPATVADPTRYTMMKGIDHSPSATEYFILHGKNCRSVGTDPINTRSRKGRQAYQRRLKRRRESRHPTETSQ